MAKKKKKSPKMGRVKQKQQAQQSVNGDRLYSSRKHLHGFAVDTDDEKDEDPTHTMFRGFDGSTSRHFTSLGPSLKLRHRSIAFISAGTNTPLESVPSTEPEQRTAIGIVSNVERPAAQVVEPQAVHEPENMDIAASEVNMVANSLDLLCQISSATASGDRVPSEDGNVLNFVVDTTGDATLTRPTSTPAKLLPVRIASPAPSDSSEEVIVFRGRNKAYVVDDPPRQSFSNESALPPHLRDRDVLHPLQEPMGFESASTSNTSQEKPAKSRQAADSQWTPAPPGAWWRAQPGPVESSKVKDVQQPGPGIQIAAKDGAEATITILQAAWKEGKIFEQRQKAARMVPIDAVNDRVPRRVSRRGKKARRRDNLLMGTLVEAESDPEDSAYRDYIENLMEQDESVENTPGDGEHDAQVHQKESSVVDIDVTDWEDTEGDDGDDDGIIAQDFEDVYGDQSPNRLSDPDSSELEEQIEEAEQEIIFAENQLEQKRLRSMTDEQIARLWAKQLELGIDADELVIDDGEIAFLDEDNNFGDVAAARAGLTEYIALASSSKKSRRNRQDILFPDASALADAVEQYGNSGFDIMDLDRPSLRPTKKGRKAKMPPELDALSDEELKQNMLNAWDNDRAKKRVKKAEREELRVRGLLRTGKTGKVELNDKYRQGITIEEIQVELRTFLQDDQQSTRAFPPMDKADRKILHEIARVLGLKSKSVGTGENRAPILYKTKMTRDYNDAAMQRTTRMISRRFLRNQTFKTKVASKGMAPFKRSTVGGSTGLRHGEVVGAGAREIGKENFGSKLMEKMGWTRGTALGKDGEGLLQPVEQMMRIGKAGLG